MRMDDALLEFLKGTGRLEDVEALGPATDLDKRVRDNTTSLVRNLQRTRGTSDRIIWVLVGLHVALFAACVYIGVAYANNSPVVTLLLGGGSLLGILKIATSLRDAWREKFLSDLLAGVAPSLSPRDLVTLVETIFYGRKQKRSARRKKAPITTGAAP